jgi:transcription elongation factor Elf1
MYCPYCNHKNHLEIDLHADGFSKDLLECTECGAILETHGQIWTTIHKPTKPFTAAP